MKTKAGAGKIMTYATGNVITIPPTTSIIEAVEVMTEKGFRRLPVTDPGTNKLKGIITAGDILNLMGGGEKYNLVKNKHKGNFLAAVNESVRVIMTPDVRTVGEDASLMEVANRMIDEMTGGYPIISNGGAISGIITERDLMKAMCNESLQIRVEDVMSTKIRTVGPDNPIGDVTREMTEKHFRRLPIVSDRVLYGIITASDVLKYLGTGQVFQKLVTGHINEVMEVPVRTISGKSLYTITPDKTLGECARKMIEKKVGALPVIEDSRLAGIITEHDLVKAFTPDMA